ncbi:hypothetical protein ACYAFX_23885 [Rhodococcus aetherivorans]
MTFELLPIQTLDGGGLFYDIADAPAVLRRWRDWISAAPTSVSSSLAIVNFPPLPELPEPRGAPPCTCGSRTSTTPRTPARCSPRCARWPPRSSTP